MSEVLVPPTILVVEDDHGIQELLFEVLSDAGFSVLLAGSAEEGLIFLAHESIDAMVLDLSLPGMDGYTMAQHLRAGQFPNLPIMVLTASYDVDGVVQLLRLQANDYLTKPFVTTELISRLRTLLADQR